jgi:hypothetical protein
MLECGDAVADGLREVELLDLLERCLQAGL